MVRITVDASGLKGFADRVQNDPEKRRAMGLALLRDVTRIERKMRGVPDDDRNPGMSEEDWLRLRGRFPAPEEMER